MKFKVSINGTIDGRSRYVVMMSHSAANGTMSFTNILFVTNVTVQKINTISGVTKENFRNIVVMFGLVTPIMTPIG